MATRLGAKVASQRLQFDAAQQQAAARLDLLAAALRARSPSRFERWRTRWSWPAAAWPEPLPGLYLWGGVGRGKTLLMDLFFSSLQDPAENRAVRAVRSHFYHFMRDVHADLNSIKQRADPLERVAQQWAQRARVICLDEFFVSDIGDAMLLAALFAGLFRRGVTLVMTSNLPPEELYKDGLQRQRFLPAIASIGRHLDVIHLGGAEDYRLRNLARAPTYLDSTRAGSDAALHESFAALAGGMDTGSTVLQVAGRTLAAVNTAPGIAWFEFSELCEGPRSQLDYMELARRYQTLIIADVPAFDAGNEDAARRFIMLIDQLYAGAVKIVVSAVAPPGGLYHGERLHVEFARAASRLIEMQTNDYLAGRHRP